MKKSKTNSPFLVWTTACICLLAAGCDNFFTPGTEVIAGSHDGTFYALGFLPSGENRVYSGALGVSPDGAAVVGYSSSVDAGSVLPDGRGFIWTVLHQAMRELAGVDSLDPEVGAVSYAEAVANEGSVVAGHVGRFGTFPYPARWDGNLLLEVLLDPAPPVPGAFGEAHGISAEGSVIVGSVLVSEVQAYHAFRWSSGEGLILLDDEDPDDFYSSSANDVSNDGSVVVGLAKLQASRWEDGVLTILGSLEGRYSEASAVSADGAVVVGWSGSREAFRWENGVMQGLGYLPGHDRSEAHDVSADGAVIIGRSFLTSERGLNDVAFIWTEAGGMQDLQEVLENDYGLSLPGWQLYSANGISDDGTVIAGEGCNTNRELKPYSSLLGACQIREKNGVREAWVVYLDRPLATRPGTRENHAPTAQITAPAAGVSFPAGTAIDFVGSAGDDEDGALTGGALVWTSSLDGEIGTGESFTRSDLSVGTHTITLTATDSEGATGTASVTVEIENVTTAGCEAFDLRLDFNPIEVAAGGSDAVAVFVDRTAGFTGQVELTFYSVNGGPRWPDVMTTWAFDPKFVPGDASASTFSFTVKEGVSAGDYAFGIAGGSPLLEAADPPCTIPVTFRVQ